MRSAPDSSFAARACPHGSSRSEIGGSRSAATRKSTFGSKTSESPVSMPRIELHSDGNYYLVDTSRNQTTYLNGRRILEARPVLLADGDRITIGDEHVVFRCESRVLPVESDDRSSVLETIADLSSFHLAKRMRRPAETLRAVLNVNRSLGGGGELDEVLGRFVDSLMELFPMTECGLIVTAEPDGGLPVRAMRTRGGPPPKLTLSRTILRQVLEQGEAVLIRDVATDERFNSQGSISALFRSAVCVPLLGSAGRSIGMIQLGAGPERGSSFTGEELDLLAALAVPVASAVENHRLLGDRAPLGGRPGDPEGALAPRAARARGILLLGMLPTCARSRGRLLRLHPNGRRRAGRRLPMGYLRGGRRGQGRARGLAIGRGLSRGPPCGPNRGLTRRRSRACQPPRLQGGIRHAIRDDDHGRPGCATTSDHAGQRWP